MAFANYWSVFGSGVFNLTDREEDPTLSSDGFQPIRTRLGLAYQDVAIAIMGDRLERLADVRRDGYAVNYGETSGDEVGVAAPVFDHRGEVVATILVAAPRYRVPESALPQLTRACTTAARRVSQRLGAPLG